MTRREEDEMVAHALEIEPALLVFATELLADLDVLGANASLIIDALRELGVSGQSVVVDLGCGKGGVSIAIAASLGCQVVGVDLFEPFIDIARGAAEAAGVGALCRFVHGNISDLATTVGPADAVVYAALGDVLGPLESTMAVIRDYAKPGGYVIVNDSFLRDTSAAVFPGFEGYTDLAGTRNSLTACGDELALELLEPTEGSTAEADEGALIAARAAALAERHPDLASAFEDFARAQQDAYAYLAEDAIGGAVWALRRR